MRNYLFILICCLYIGINAAYAQQEIPKTIKIVKPHVVNFSERAAYQLKHPSKGRPRSFVEQGEEKDKEFKFKPKPVPANAAKFNVTLPNISTRSVSPSPDIVFNGTMDNDYLTPPDVDGVIGDSLIMETNNQEFDVFTKSGILIHSVYLNTFFASVSSYFFFDPHIIYDPQAKRYILSADGQVSNGNCGVFLGISQTSDPTGNWNVYGVQAAGNTANFLDFPMLGYNKNWVVITGNDFIAPAEDNAYTQIFVFNKDSVYNNSSVTVQIFSDSSMFSLSPAETSDTTQGTEYFVADWNGDSTNSYGYVRLASLTGTPNAPVYTDGQFMGINHPWNENLVQPMQLGNPNGFYAVDTRVDFAKYINGSLWFSHTVFLPDSAPTYDAVDWWQVNPSTATLQQYGRVGDTSGNTFYFFPSMNVNSDNDALLGYATSSYTSYAGAGYVYRMAIDPPNTMEGGNLFQPGLAPYYKTHGGGLNRWGDFTGTAIDPTNNSFWTFQMYANIPSSNWCTVIANVLGTNCDGIPTAGTISVAQDTICSGTKAILDLFGNTIAEGNIQVQWQQSENGVTWSNVSSNISTVASQFVSAPLYQTTYFRGMVICKNTQQFALSNVVAINVTGLLSVTNDTICTPGNYNIVANGVGNIKWYLSDTSANPVSMKDTLNATVVNDTTFYVTVGSPSNYTVGITDSTVGSGGSYTRYDEGLEFTALNDFVIDSVFVYPYSTGTVQVNLVDNETNITLQSKSFSIPSGAVYQKTSLPLNMAIEGGYDYKLNAIGTIDSGLYITTTMAYPYVVPGVVSINRSIDFISAYTDSYYFFYDWHVSTSCASVRVPVQVKIDTAMVVITAKSDTLCDGDTLTLNASGAISYNWTPGSLAGGSIKVNPTVTTTYSITGTDTHGCAANNSFTVNVINCTTGISSALNTINVKLYPDPAFDKINIITEGTLPGNTSFEIDNVLGQRLVSNEFLGGTTLRQIDISSFTPGIYFYKFISGNNQIAKGKFVKE